MMRRFVLNAVMERSADVYKAKWFKQLEFRCKCGKCERLDVSDELLILLDKIRDCYGKAVKVTSGHRCPAYNKKVGSEPTSSHVKGLAADLVAEGGTERVELLHCIMVSGARRVGVYPNFFHVDVDTSKPDAIWVG